MRQQLPNIISLTQYALTSDAVLTAANKHQANTEESLLKLELLSRFFEVGYMSIHAHQELLHSVLESTPLIVNIISGLSEMALGALEMLTRDDLSHNEKVHIATRFLTGTALITTAVVGLSLIHI